MSLNQTGNSPFPCKLSHDDRVMYAVAVSFMAIGQLRLMVESAFEAADDARQRLTRKMRAPHREMHAQKARRTLTDRLIV
jgi:hypothetical protein